MRLGKYTERILAENPVLSREEIDSLIRVYKSSTDEQTRKNIREKIVNSNLKLVLRKVNSLCRMVPNLRNYFDELFREGVLGLEKAVEKYEIGRGANFTSCACWWIKKKTSLFTNHLRRKTYSNISLDELLIGEKQRHIADIIHDDKQTPPDARELDYAQVVLLVNQLPEREREIIYRRYGLNNHDKQTFREIGEVLGVTYGRVQQLEKSALRKLRQMIA